MKRPVKIIVEGVADVRFVQDYISFLFGEDLKEKTDILSAGGWTRLDSDSAFVQQLNQNRDNGGVNLIIFDADADCQARRKEILDWKEANNLDFELFLFPNDNDPGVLETLLERIINPNNAPIFDCWEKYEKCLGTKEIEGRSEPLTRPAIKTKIYGYLEALLGESLKQKEQIKERERNYKNPDHWNLNAEAIAPLREFLLANLSES